ncbi:MAG: magnesium transporter [bacterium]
MEEPTEPVRVADETFDASELREAWTVLSEDDRFEGFRLLPRVEAEDFFMALSALDQAALLTRLPADERRSWVRLLPPDDVADLVQEVPIEERDSILALLDAVTRKEVTALLLYAEDEAGGLMSPRYARVRPEMTADEAIRYLRRQVREHPETIYYAYALDAEQRPIGVLSLRELFMAPPDSLVADVMQSDLVLASDDLDQEALSQLFRDSDLVAIPVVDSDGKMKGIVTADDILDVVEEEATEDMQKYGGVEALDAPYLNVGFFSMIRKRAGWLVVLFVGEMLTATAMGYFEHEISRAVVLALFIPLIISSGGNTGSQASTLVIRAMALGEVRLADWWRVMRREIAAGLTLGTILGAIGFVRILMWPSRDTLYGEHYLLIAFTVSASLVGVVLWGALSGSMLPLVLRRVGFDPASASAPFVATLVDVSGIVIYFTVASLLLRGTLL